MGNDTKDTKADNSMGCNLDPVKAKEISFVVGAEKDWKDDTIEPPTGKSFGPGMKHSHASYYAEITGDMEGWATHNYIMTMSGIDESKKTSEDDCGAGRCDWAGHALFTGSILGRKGSIVIAQWGVCAGETLEVNWALIDETATGDLKGVKGGGSFTCDAKPGIPQPGKIKVQFD